MCTRTEATTHDTEPPTAPAFLRALRIVHPFPTLLNVAATAALAIVAAGGIPHASVLARMLALMLCAQSAIGVTNDIFDRHLDAATKPWKPIPAGLVPLGLAAGIAASLIVATVAIGATLGARSLALAALGTACGLAYDVRLKRTALSALPFMVAIPVLPLWVWQTLGEWDDVLWWLLPLGGLIGLSLHLANTLPDIDADTSHGVRGLAHRLGLRTSTYVAWGAFALALAWSLALVPFVEYDRRVYVPAVAFGAVTLAVSFLLAVRRPEGGALQFGFGALGAGAAVLATAWLAAVT